MAIAPHCLDAAFSAGNASVSSIAQAMFKIPHFTEAIEEGHKAYAEAEESFRNNPKLMAPTPAQSARTAFLAALGHETHR